MGDFFCWNNIAKEVSVVCTVTVFITRYSYTIHETPNVLQKGGSSLQSGITSKGLFIYYVIL